MYTHPSTSPLGLTRTTPHPYCSVSLTRWGGRSREKVKRAIPAATRIARMAQYASELQKAMFRPLPSLAPNVDDLLLLPVEQLAEVLLVHLNSFSDGGNAIAQFGRINQHNVFNDLARNPPYPTRREELHRALLEAWSWLVSEGLLSLKLIPWAPHFL